MISKGYGGYHARAPTDGRIYEIWLYTKCEYYTELCKAEKCQDIKGAFISSHFSASLSNNFILNHVQYCHQFIVRPICRDSI